MDDPVVCWIADSMCEDWSRVARLDAEERMGKTITC